MTVGGARTTRIDSIRYEIICFLANLVINMLTRVLFRSLNMMNKSLASIEKKQKKTCVSRCAVVAAVVSPTSMSHVDVIRVITGHYC